MEEDEEQGGKGGRKEAMKELRVGRKTDRKEWKNKRRRRRKGERYRRG